MDIGRRIREVREDLGMQATVLARRTGVSPNTIYRIETGERTPSVALLERIARELRTEPAELLRESAPKGQAPTPSRSGRDDARGADREAVDKPFWVPPRTIEAGPSGDADEEVFEVKVEYDFELATKRILVWDELVFVFHEARASGLKDDEITKGLLQHVEEWVLAVPMRA